MFALNPGQRSIKFTVSESLALCDLAGVRRLHLALAALAALYGLSGCAGTGTNTTKDRGVYTTLVMEGHNLDMPGSGYIICKNFAPGQAPAAVIVGYGYWDGAVNHPEQFELQLIETATGATLLDSSGFEYANKAAVLNLPIRKTGNYQLKLLVNNSVADTWDFSVDRGTPADTASNAPPPVYAKGIFSCSLEQKGGAEFADYDNYFLSAVNNAVQKSAGKTDGAIFSQVPAGKVVVTFRLDNTGNVSSPQIVESTLNVALAQFFLQALQDGAPYKPWPADQHTREMKLTFYYD